MSKFLKASPFLLLILVFNCNLAFAQKTFQDYYHLSVETYKKGAYRSFLENAKKADSLRPNHPLLMYNLAAGYALNEQIDKAVAILGKRMDFYASDEFKEDDDFKAIRDSKNYHLLVEKMKRMTTPRQSSTPAFTISEPGFHPEGITFCRSLNRFLLGDIRSGKILSYKRDGSGSEQVINLSDYGFWSVMGMAMDADHPNQLWVATAAMPEFEHYTTELKGRSAVLLIDIDTGRIVKKYEPEGEHLFGDLAVGSGGRVLVSDSMAPQLFVINRAESSMKILVADERWWNLQGVALSKDQQYLYVADYVNGIFKVDIETKSVHAIMHNNAATRGADGIYINENELLFVQNGTLPKRIGKFKLNKQGNAVEETLHFTDQALEILNEPTLGTIVDRKFYYIANSPWAYYDQNHEPVSQGWPDVQVWMLDLNN